MNQLKAGAALNYVIIILSTIVGLLYTPFGMTILEAMAYCLPVIVPAAGGPVELTGNAGYRMDVTDIDAVGKKIDELFRDRALYSEISEECLLRAESFKEK